MPPPRSEAHCHQPLRGVMTTSGAGPDASRPTVATTEYAEACVRTACAIRRTLPPPLARAFSDSANSGPIWSTGQPYGLVNDEALVGATCLASLLVMTRI